MITRSLGALTLLAAVVGVGQAESPPRPARVDGVATVVPLASLPTGGFVSAAPAAEVLAAPTAQATPTPAPATPTPNATPPAQPSKDGAAKPDAAKDKDKAADPKADEKASKAKKPTQEELLRDDHYGPEERIWARAEYLTFWTKDARLPFAIATTGPSPANQGTTGALDQPGTAVLLGNSNASYGAATGGRLTLGGALDDCHRWAYEVSSFLLETTSISQGVTSNNAGSPVIARPFTDPLIPASQPGNQTAVLVAAPGLFAGGVALSSTSRLWSGELTAVRNIWNDVDIRIDFLGGFRYLDLQENLSINSTSTSLNGTQFSQVGVVGGPIPTTLPGVVGTLNLQDNFHASNQFFGGQFGVRTEYSKGSYFGTALAKVAFGPNNERVSISGTSALTAAQGGTAVVPGALLALPNTNIGIRRINYFTVLPEVEGTVGVYLTNHIKLHAGYSFLYINDVVRPADQVSTTLSRRFIPSDQNFNTLNGPVAPVLNLRQAGYFAHGLNFGLTFSY